MLGNCLRRTLIISVLCSLGWWACGGGSEPPIQGGEPEAEESELCSEFKADLVGQITCFSAAAAERDDLTVCDQAFHEGVQYQCYALFAERRDNPEACEKIPTDTEEMQGLRDVCLSDVAANREDPELCATIVTPGLRDSCYAKVAERTGDLAICEQIEDPVLKSGCTGEPYYIE